MRQSSVVQALLKQERKEIARKEKAQAIISILEVRFGEVDDTIQNCLVSIQDEDALKYLLRQSAISEKSDIERTDCPFYFLSKQAARSTGEGG